MCSNPQLPSQMKINSKCIKDLNVKPEMLKPMEKHIENAREAVGTGKSLLTGLTAQETVPQTTDDTTRNLSLCTTKKTIG